MTSARQNSCWPEVIDHPLSPKGWSVAHLSCIEETMPLIDAVAAAMTDHGYPQDDVFGVSLALSEALFNSIKHGHQNDPAKQVEVRYSISPEHVVVEVEDQGEGFDPLSIPDPTDVEGLEQSCGRGLMLMRCYTTWLRFNERGNCVTFCKRLGAALA